MANPLHLSSVKKGTSTWRKYYYNIASGQTFTGPFSYKLTSSNFILLNILDIIQDFHANQLSLFCVNEGLGRG